MSVINYDHKVFSSVNSSSNAEVSEETLFYYRQEGNIVWAKYSGGAIVKGHLIALVSDDGSLDMRYHHVNTAHELMTGICHSVPETLADGRLRLHEQWQWTTGDRSKGTSIIEEIGDPI